MGAAALKKYQAEHPELVRRNAVLALAKGREIKLAQQARIRQLREEELARLRLLSSFPSKSPPAVQIKWVRNACLKIARSPVPPPKWMLPALAGMLACARAASGQRRAPVQRRRGAHSFPAKRSEAAGGCLRGVTAQTTGS